jgi:hypothetical protein
MLRGGKAKATKQRQCKRKVSGLTDDLGNKKYIKLLYIMGASKCAYFFCVLMGLVLCLFN